MIVELDAQLLVDLLDKANDSSSLNNLILADRKEGLKLIPQVKIQHCYRETNKCVDALVQRGALLNVDFFFFCVFKPSYLGAAFSKFGQFWSDF